MFNKKLSRRSFIRNTSLAAGGLILANGCNTSQEGKHRYASQISEYNPKRDGGCAVSLGYDVDMPRGGLEYLYDRKIGWLTDAWDDAHGHLNDDIRDYIYRISSIADGYDANLQFFVQGNTFEIPEDTAVFKDISQKGHAIDSHMYYHHGLINTPIEDIKAQLIMTKNTIEEKCNTVNVGLRGPGGYRNALHGREDVQKAILEVGIKWVSTQFQYPPDDRDNDRNWINMIPEHQPFYYKTGLLEIPFCAHQDRSFFDVDMGGSPRPVDEWIGYLKACVDLAYEQNLFLSLTVHPSTSFKHDPKARYVKELMEYCRKRPDILVCTYSDMYRWISKEKEE
ncbi:polysaccharide deacetylase family protein [Bacteroidota bacterium]